MEHKFFIVIEFGNFSLRLQNNLNILCSINFILKIKIGNGESEWETNAFPIFIELFWVFLHFFYKYFICEMGYVFTILFYIFFFFLLENNSIWDIEISYFDIAFLSKNFHFYCWLREYQCSAREYDKFAYMFWICIHFNFFCL